MKTYQKLFITTAGIGFLLIMTAAFAQVAGNRPLADTIGPIGMGIIMSDAALVVIWFLIHIWKE